MKETHFHYGGQAVIEGVMMRGQKSLAIAVRKGPGNISLAGWAIEAPGKRPGFLRWPLIRGTVGLIDSLVIGVKTLVFSADEMLDDEGYGPDETAGTAGTEEDASAAGLAEPGEKKKASLSNWEIALTIALSLGLGIVLFFLLPAFLAQVIRRWAPSHSMQNIFEALMRIGIFMIYIFAISRIKDIQRVFQYHGAEHKTIFAYEAGLPLTVENAAGMSRLHPRCGTSFLLLVMVVSILLYSLLPPLSLAQRLLSRLLLLPVIAGIAYELIRLAGRRLDHPLVAAISWPGLQLQRLTTREPDESQLEVAIMALTSVLRDDGLLPPFPEPTASQPEP